jgi:antitoxin component of RelBE/YafQ-DinJ toxin-antitoxin module
MTDIFRVRVERKLLAKASRLAEEMGTSPGEIVRLLFAQMVKRRALPFSVVADGEPEGARDLINPNHRNRIWRQLDDSEGW